MAYAYRLSFFIIYVSAKGEARERLDSALEGVTDKFKALEHSEKSYVRKAMLEERRHYCDFICCLRPVVVCADQLLSIAPAPYLLSPP